MILLHCLRIQNFKQITDLALCFPDKGTILIEGHNEAGKSSLFEAVYFAFYGRPLIPDKDYRLEYLRTYGAEELVVELEFSIGGRRYVVSRRLKGQHKASLRVQKEDGTEETINGNTPVTQRLQEELRISSDSLLNSCFVEQKRLERLEQIDISDRRKTINELLNLRALTTLHEECKVTRQEEAALKQLKGRVEVAQLDTQIPTLVATVRRAHLCLLFTQLREAEEHYAGLQNEIDLALTRLESIRVRTAEIDGMLAACAQLRLLIDSIDTDLPRRILAWSEAGTAVSRAKDTCDNLQRIADELPARERRWEQWSELANHLLSLERLEAAIADGIAMLETTRREIEAFDHLEAEWKQGEERLLTLSRQIETQRTRCGEAEETVQRRARLRERMESLNGMAQQIQILKQAMGAHAEACLALEAASKEALRLPALNNRLTGLDRLLKLWETRERMLARQTELHTSLETLRRVLQEWTAEQEKVTYWTDQIRIADERLQTARDAERQVVERLQRADQRLALETWAEAAERCAEFGVEATSDSGLAGRVKQSEERVASASQEAQRSAKAPLPGYAMIGAGLLAGIGAVVLGQLLIGIILACLLISIGGALTLKGQKAIRTSQEMLNAANLERATLEGERKSVEARMQSNALQYQTWRQREVGARQVLESAGIHATTPVDARALLETIPTIDVPATQQEQQRLVLQRQRLELERGSAVQALDTARQNVARIDPAKLQAQILGTEQELQGLLASLPSTEGLEADARLLEVQFDKAAIQQEILRVNGEIAVATTQQTSLPELEINVRAKAHQVEEEQAKTYGRAQELGLEGASIGDWSPIVASEQEQLRRKLAEMPYDILQETVRREQRALDDLNKQLATLESEQGRRKTGIEAKPRASMVDEYEAIETTLNENRSKCELLLSVRQTLLEDGLPQESGALNAALASEQTKIETDRREVARLPQEQAFLAKCHKTLEARRADCGLGWQEVFQEPLPQNPEQATQALPIRRQKIVQQLEAYRQPELEREVEQLEREDRKIGEENAKRRHQQQEDRNRRAALLQEIGCTTDESPSEHLPETMPELQGHATYDVEGWQRELKTSIENLNGLQNRRQTLAQIHDVSAESLDLQVTQEAATEAELEIAIKKRSGEIVERTRQSIVSRVMPLTMQNVNQLLPLLTEGRYNDVKWDEGNSLLEVYDTRSRSYQRKRIFSGGARDQISLSLRLGFALATLPGEHNTRPGWLFLDEPLSSFDRTRTQALVDLLTRGLIRKQFAQIFLVSHSESFDPRLFDHRLRMEAGSIVETTLDSEYSS